jgi:hypothetical protein
MRAARMMSGTGTVVNLSRLSAICFIDIMRHTKFTSEISGLDDLARGGK